MQVNLRRGLPRVPGGTPWPPEGSFVTLPDAPLEPDLSPVRSPEPHASELTAVALRRGLPRVPGGEPFPPAAHVMLRVPDRVVHAEVLEAPAQPETVIPHREGATAEAPAPDDAAGAGRGGVEKRWPRILLSALAAVAVFAVAVGVARWFIGTDTGASFTSRYTGEQPLPAGAPVGLPAWLNWAHFFNMFLMALIVKTGLGVRSEARPEALWAPRSDPKRKVSLTLWLHLCLDIAWLALGAVFYVLLFATGQWMRLVPTSWEVVPHAVSAGLQYLSLRWPVENGWVTYNALQELTYCAVVFLAAPLAALSGLRMSPWWPRSWSVIPVRIARKAHVSTMVFFLVFIVVHVLLVVLTGLRRNMNAMFAARGDIDPSVYSADWTGTVVFVVAAALTGLAVWAARPVVIAPLARLSGTVTNR
ncbi:hypothetical protein CAPI_02990 [Corynebacterium capitovis DSM 44611]|uniref:cytochrome b/b6 domain-containing protein n=1 Tax=Corynebacterium capitovis TaxID=131081 RepID=UPI000380F78C|nr:cytochrome b/b6 domain-containing protein [Corynebacterium capitovis]WKD57162.1 hypothetical protein CAPI_02990 [Corynebacterium capitovis DSM 44611]